MTELFSQLLDAKEMGGFPLAPTAERDFYTFIEAEIILQECTNCNTMYYEEVEDEICPECEESVMNYTNAEDKECANCKYNFDMWEDHYEGRDGNNYCKSCVEELVED